VKEGFACEQFAQVCNGQESNSQPLESQAKCLKNITPPGHKLHSIAKLLIVERHHKTDAGEEMKEALFWLCEFEKKLLIGFREK